MRSKHGKVLKVQPPTPAALERHRVKFGPDCVELPDEKRSVVELRESGLSIAEIIRVSGLSEKRVRAQLLLT